MSPSQLDEVLLDLIDGCIPTGQRSHELAQTSVLDLSGGVNISEKLFSLLVLFAIGEL